MGGDRGLQGARVAACAAAFAIGWLGGVALQLQQAALAPPWLAVGLALAPVLAWPWRRHALAWCVAAAAFGFATATVQAGARLADTLDPALEGADLVVEGVVATLPQRGFGVTRFVLEVAHAARPGGAAVRLPARLALGWFAPGGFADDAFDTLRGGAHEAPRAGEAWRLGVRLKAPHGSLNPHGSDFELQLFQRGIGATGSVRHGERLGGGAGAPVERARQWARDAIEARVADPRAAGVLAALAVGDQGAIEWFLSKLSYAR